MRIRAPCPTRLCVSSPPYGPEHFAMRNLLSTAAEPTQFHLLCLTTIDSSPSVNHANTASTAYKTIAIRSMRFTRPISSTRPYRTSILQTAWCTGEDSNLRSSNERQIYSLLPLTTRPPVHILSPLSCANPSGFAARSALAGHFSGIIRSELTSVGSPRRRGTKSLLPPAPSAMVSEVELAKGFEPPTL